MSGGLTCSLLAYGDFQAIPRRLCRCTEPEHPFNTSTADIRLPMCRVMDSGGKQPVEGIIHMTEGTPSVHFMAASDR